MSRSLVSKSGSASGLGLVVWTVCVLLSTLFSSPVPGQTTPVAEVVHGDFRNIWFTESPAPPQTPAESTSFFGGDVFLEGSDCSGVEPPEGCATNETRTYYLERVSFGQPVARDAVPTAFIEETLDTVRKELYYWAAAEDDTDPYLPENAAFRYQALLYELDACPGADPCGSADPEDNCGPFNVLENQDRSISYYYTAADRATVEEAKGRLRSALKARPTHSELREALLDLFYDQAAAETMLAKEALVEVARCRIFPDECGWDADGFAIGGEIEAYRDALEAYREALAGYFELLHDPMAVNVPALGGPPIPFGYYLFLEEVPYRPLYAATYVTADGPLDVRTCEPPADPLFPQFKDLTMLLNLLSDYAETADGLARLYVMRSQAGDLVKARRIVKEAHQKLYLEGNLLLNFEDLPEVGDDLSGLPEAIRRWRQSLTQISTAQSYVDGESNTLGFAEDFLMLVEALPGSGHFDSYDFLYDYINTPQGPLSRALTKYQEARSSYGTYRGYQDQLDQQYQSRRESYESRLFKIVGAQYCEGTDEDCEECLSDTETCYLRPEDNEGSEVWQQLRSIEVSRNRLEYNETRIANLHTQIEYEVERRGQEAEIENAISNIYIQYEDQYTQLTEELADMRADVTELQAEIESTDDFLSDLVTADRKELKEEITTARSARLQAALQRESARQEVERQRLQGRERAEVRARQAELLDLNSQAKIKNWLLQESTANLDVLQTKILLAQETARLKALYDEIEELERRMAQVSVDLAGRYFADPVHRLRMETDMIEAHEAFEEAQKWVFFAARALEYKWNLPFVHQIESKEWSLNSVFKCRNAWELAEAVNAMSVYNSLVELTSGREDRFDRFSVREDFFGYPLLSEDGEIQYYEDPENPDNLVNAVEAFRSQLRLLMDEYGFIILRFSTVREIPGGHFFFGPRMTSEGFKPGEFLDKIDYMQIALPGAHSLGRSTIWGYLTYGGTGYIRNWEMGTYVVDDDGNIIPNHVEDEMTAYSTRSWYYDAPSGSWRSTDGLSAFVDLELTENPDVPPTVLEIRDFTERSVAATGWRLIIPTVDLGEQVLNIDELNDIEIYFYHWSVTRPGAE